MSKEDAMKEVMDLIEEKVKRRKELRDGSKKDATHAQEVLKFLNNLDSLAADSMNEIDFYVSMERECSMLKYRLKSFDPYVDAVVEWNDTKNWRELRPLGVRISWSKYYMKLHPNAEQEEYVDIGRLLLDDYD